MRSYFPHNEIISRRVVRFYRDCGKIKMFGFFERVCIVIDVFFAVFYYNVDIRSIYAVGIIVEFERIFRYRYVVTHKTEVAVYPDISVGHGRIVINGFSAHSRPTAETVSFFFGINRRVA